MVLILTATTALVQHLVFGYGSLLCQHSRAVTSSTLLDTPVLPVIAKGIQRIWAKRSIRGMTSLGVRLVETPLTEGKTQTNSSKPQCVGAVFPVWNPDELAKLDEREQGYQRVPLTLEHIQQVPYLANQYNGFAGPLASSSDDKYNDPEYWLRDWLDHVTTRQYSRQQFSQPKPHIWTYVPLQEQWPDPDFPIAQSYVDTILRGCLSYSPDMAHDFILSTEGWDCHHGDGKTLTTRLDKLPACWLDDRHAPIYPRGDPAWSRENAQKIDALLQQHLPSEMARRVFRSAAKEQNQ